MQEAPDLQPSGEVAQLFEVTEDATEDGIGSFYSDNGNAYFQLHVDIVDQNEEDDTLSSMNWDLSASPTKGEVVWMNVSEVDQGQPPHVVDETGDIYIGYIPDTDEYIVEFAQNDTFTVRVR